MVEFDTLYRTGLSLTPTIYESVTLPISGDVIDVYTYFAVFELNSYYHSFSSSSEGILVIKGVFNPIVKSNYFNDNGDCYGDLFDYFNMPFV